MQAWEAEGGAGVDYIYASPHRHSTFCSMILFRGYSITKLTLSIIVTFAITKIIFIDISVFFSKSLKMVF